MASATGDGVPSTSENNDGGELEKVRARHAG